MKQLFPVQIRHAAALSDALRKYNSALDSSATGTGKTLIACEIAKHLARPTLVIAPKKALPQWREEMNDRKVAAELINYEMLRTGRTELGCWIGRGLWKWNIDPSSFVIWDEGHKCKGLRTQNSSIMVSSKAFTNLIASATAAESPAEMRALGYLLGLHHLRDFYPWARARGCSPNQWRSLDFNNDTTILDHLHQEIFPEHGSRLTRADMKEHFQDTQIITTPIDFGAELSSIYTEMEEEISNLAEIMLSDSRNAEALTAQLRARQKVELLKVPVIIEMIEELLTEKQSVAIFVNFEATLQAIHERFPGSGIIHGKQSSKKQHQVNMDFQADKIRVLICNVQAGGESINLHDTHGVYPRTSIISPSWSAREIIQCIGRIDRAGGETPSQQHVLFAANTIEATVEKVVRRKRKSIEIINDGVDKTPIPCSISLTMIEDEKNAAHAEYPPSSLESIERCPGFINRSGNPSPSADKGTRIHKALEADTVTSLDEEERHIAQMCKDVIDAAIADRLPILPDTDLREVKMTMDLGGDVKTFGTCDRLLGYSSFGLMYDYKSGYREVSDAEVNPQAWAYVIGAFQKYQQFDEIQFTFLIPNRDEILTHTFKRSDVASMRLRLNTIIRRAMVANPEQFSPQPELCEYCARQTTCPALGKKTAEFARKLRPELTIPSNIQIDREHPEDIPHLLRLAPLLEAQAKGIREAALRLNLEEGVDIAGFKRIERSTPRGVTSVLGAWDAMKDKITLEDFLATCSTVSVPQLEELFGAQAKYGEKGKSRKEVEKRLRHADVLIEEGTRFYLKEEKR